LFDKNREGLEREMKSLESFQKHRFELETKIGKLEAQLAGTQLPNPRSADPYEPKLL
jgi:hypothetical protein